MPGYIASYTHDEGRAAALVLLRFRESTSARTAELQLLGRELAMQVVAMRPAVVAPSDVDEVAWRQELAGLRGTGLLSGTSADRLGEINAARANYERTFCLLKQPFVKDSTLTVEQRIEEVAAQLSETIEVVRFSFLEAGEVE